MSESTLVPPLGAIMAYRGVYALSTITTEGRLRATHYATCLVGGRDPMWGVWTVNGVFQRFFGSRDQIARSYPKLTWRRKNATWHMVEVNDMDAKAKKRELASLFHRGDVAESKPLAGLFEDGDVKPWSDSFEGQARPLFAHALRKAI